MNLVVLNVGSGSERCALFELERPLTTAEPRDPVWQAKLDTTAPGQPPGRLRVQVRRKGGPPHAEVEVDAGSSIEERTARLLRLLWEGAPAPVSHAAAIDAVAHRIVHGGDRFNAAIRIDAAVEAAIEELAPFAPLHNPPGLAGIRSARAVFGPRLPQVAVFDTAFHQTLPEAAATYAGPWEWRRRGIRRYGFHGINYRWVAERAAQLLGREGDPELGLILAHLGGGCSLCATRGGRSLDTTMGFTPLDGIAMSTRSGALDPGILLHLLRGGETVDGLEEMLNRESGLKGLSGISGDTRVLRPKLAAGDSRARLAWDVFIHQLRGGIGRMLAALGSAPAALVFTDAMAEDEPDLRAAACAPFRFLGVELDEATNRQSPLDADLAAPGSAVRVLLIKSREAWQIAREAFALCVGASEARRDPPG